VEEHAKLNNIQVAVKNIQCDTLETTQKVASKAYNVFLPEGQFFFHPFSICSASFM
jgi:hypothetical protein